MKPILPILLALSIASYGQIVVIPGSMPVSQSRQIINDNFAYLDSVKSPNLSFTSPLVKTGTVVSIPLATTSVSGYLSSTDWNLFTAKSPALTFSSPLIRTGDTITCPTCGSGTPGGSNGQIQYNSSSTFAGGNLSGDVTTTNSLVTTLANSGVSAGSCGDSTHSCGITVNAKGLITVMSNNAISGGGGGGGGAPYSTTTITASPMTILASTHGQGIYAFGNCWDAATNPQIEETCNWKRDPATGDLILTYTIAPAQLDIFGSTGGVTSIAMTGDNVIYNTAVTGSPITTTGTLVPVLKTQTANTILAGPTTGSAATPTFRALVAADFPAVATFCPTCVVSSSPGAGIAHFAGSTQTVTSSAIVNADITNGTIDLTTKVTGLLPTTNMAAASLVRQCIVVIGDPGAASTVLASDNDSPVACSNTFGADWTILSVGCWADAGSPTVTPILTGGTGTSVLTGALTCGTASWAAGTVQGTAPVVHSFTGGATCSSTPCSIDANITTAGGVAKYIVMKIVGTL